MDSWEAIPNTPSGSGSNILGYNYEGLANGLVDYALKKLGAPILNIDVAPEQINYALGDSIQYFNEYTKNGSERTFLAYQITKNDKDRFGTNDYSIVDNIEKTESVDDLNNLSSSEDKITKGKYKDSQNFIVLPEWVFGVTRVYGAGGSYVRNSLLGIQFQIFLSDIYNTGGIDILSYYMVKSYLETLDWVLNTGKTVQFRYNQRVNKLYLDVDFGIISEDQWILIECFKFVDPTEAPRLFNDIFLKRYFTALLKKQWGMNLSKYNQVQLPGGVMANGPLIYQQAQEEIDKLEAEVLNKYAFIPKLIIA